MAESSNCSICLEPFSAQTVGSLRCGHVFHERCVRGWLNQSRSCPVCRASTGLSDPLIVQWRRRAEINKPAVLSDLERQRLMRELQHVHREKAAAVQRAGAARVTKQLFVSEVKSLRQEVVRCRDEVAQRRAKAAKMASSLASRRPTARAAAAAAPGPCRAATTDSGRGTPGSGPVPMCSLCGRRHS